MKYLETTKPSPQTWWLVCRTASNPPPHAVYVINIFSPHILAWLFFSNLFASSVSVLTTGPLSTTTYNFSDSVIQTHGPRDSITDDLEPTLVIGSVFARFGITAGCRFFPLIFYLTKFNNLTLFIKETIKNLKKK